MKQSSPRKPHHLLFAAFLALAAMALMSGCAAYTAANDENPGARSLGGGRSHGSDTGHTH